MHQADNAGPSMAPLCKVPSGGKEGTISGGCFLLGRHHYWGHWSPSCISGAQWGPDLTAEGRDPGVGQRVLFLSWALSPRGRKGLRNWGGDRGWGGHLSPSDAAAAASHLLPALRARASSGLAGVRRRGLGPRPPPRRLRGADPGPGRFVLRRARSSRGPTKLPLCPAASAVPGDVSPGEAPTGAERGLRRPLVDELASAPCPGAQPTVVIRCFARPTPQAPPLFPYPSTCVHFPMASRKPPHSLSPSPSTAEALQPSRTLPGPLPR